MDMFDPRPGGGRSSAAHGRRVPARGFSLIELMTVIVIVLVLMGLLVATMRMIRLKAHTQAVRTTILELSQAMEAYRAEDERHRFPPVNVDLSLSQRAIPGPGPGTLELLDRKGLWSPSALVRDDESRLLDGWGRPLLYSLIRPTPSAPAGALRDWNWDAGLGRERAWGRRPTAAGVVASGPLAFAYIWSLGPAGRSDDASDWQYVEDPL